MQRIKYLIAILLGLACNAQADSNWRISGYLQGVWQSQALTERSGQRLGLNDSYIESGITLDRSLSDRLHFKTQINARQPTLTHSTIASVDILALRYRLYQPIWGQVGVSAGRLKNALIGFYSAQDDPLSRPMTTHARVYLGNIPQAFSAIDGARLDMSWLSDTGHGLDAYLYAGQHVIDTDININVNSAFNVQLKNKSYETRALKLIYTSPTVPVAQLGLVAIYFDSLNRLTTPRGTLNSQIQGDVFISMGRLSATHWELAGEYAWGQIKGTSPAAALLPLPTNITQTTDFHSGYIEASWLPNPRWRLSLRYAQVEYPQLGYRQTEPFSGTSKGEGIIFYTRYQLNRTLFVGMELNRITANTKPEGHQTYSLAMFQLGLHF